MEPPSTLPPSAVNRRTPEAEASTATNVTIIGTHTVHRGVQAPACEPRVWLRDTPVCPTLVGYHIIHLGVVEARPPYRFERRSTSALELLACVSGEGRLLVDGTWMHFGPRMAALLPQNAAAGYFAIGDEPWKLVWVCYQWPAERPPLLGPDSPVLATYDATSLLHAVEGLRQECMDPCGEFACMEHWCSLIHLQVLRFARPWRSADPMSGLWRKVAATLGEDWSLSRLASEAGCCGEALRRRCQRQIGRSPMQHLTYLRLQRAAELLLTTDSKVECIASEIGYGDAFAFSAMFKKWTGLPPREFRERRHGGCRVPTYS